MSSGVSTIDVTGMETLLEVHRILGSKDIKVYTLLFLKASLKYFKETSNDIYIFFFLLQMVIINPRFEVLEKMMLSHFVEKIGKEYVFVSIDDAVQACRFNLSTTKPEP